MHFARTIPHALLLVVTGLGGFVACGGTSSGTPADSTTAANAALVVSPSSDAKSLTVTSTGGTCGDAATLVEAHQGDIRALCGSGELPLPGDVSNASCRDGQVISITFKCVQAKPPPAPGQGCLNIQIQDDDDAISSQGRQQLAALPALLCPMMGGAPPPQPQPGPNMPAPQGSETAQGNPGPVPTSTGNYPSPAPSGTGNYPPPAPTGTGNYPPPAPSGTGNYPPPAPTGTGTYPPPAPTSTNPAPMPSGTNMGGGCALPPVIQCCAPPPPAPGAPSAAGGSGPSQGSSASP